MLSFSNVKFSISILFLFTLSGIANAEENAPIPKCDAGSKIQLTVGWEKLNNLPFKNLIEGNYLGKGLISGSVYTLELKCYYSKFQAFVAILENHSSGNGSVGVVTMDKTNVYSWYPIKAENSLTIAPSMDRDEPLSKLIIEWNQDRQVHGVVLRSTGTSGNEGVEAIQFEHVRLPLLESMLPLGKWKSRHNKQHTLDISPLSSQAETETVSVEESNGSIRSYNATHVLPGIHALFNLKKENYIEKQSDSVTALLLAMKPYRCFWPQKPYEFKYRILMFEFDSDGNLRPSETTFIPVQH